MRLSKIEYIGYLKDIANRGGERGASAQAELLKFSADEERDDHGRWTSGGGGSSGPNHEDVAGHLTSIAEKAKTANASSRLKTDVLGRPADKYGSGSQTYRVKKANERIASVATRLASTISGDRSTSVSEHLANARSQAEEMHQQGMGHLMVDNFSTGFASMDNSFTQHDLIDTVESKFGLPSTSPAKK
jgi:hypothetical protein